MTARVWVDGRLVPAAEARISALDLGFRSGIGVFESLRVDQGRAFRPDAHLARLTTGARTLGFAPQTAGLRRGIADTVTGNHHLGDHLALRITCSPGPIDPQATFPGASAGPPTTVITVQPTGAASPTPSPATAISTALRREIAGTKHTSYLVSVLAQQQAAAAGCSDALLTAPSGALLEAATANLLVVVDGVVSTPPTSAGILPGVTRDAVLELAAEHRIEVVERPITRDDLYRAEEAMLTSAVRGVRALTRVDHHDVAGGRPGPLTTHLAAAYHSLVARVAEPVTVTGSPTD